MDTNAIIRFITDLPLKEALAFLAAEKIYDLSKDGFQSIRKIIRDKANSKCYGFVPKKDESNFLIKVRHKEYFNEFDSVLPNSKYSDLIRVGYLISDYNKLGGESNRKRVDFIKGSIIEKPNGQILIKIVNLVTTGSIVPVVDYLRE